MVGNNMQFNDPTNCEDQPDNNQGISYSSLFLLILVYDV